MFDPSERVTLAPVTAPAYNTKHWHRVRRAVLERDGYVCRWCGELIDRTAPARSARAASVDHVVELELGGPVLDPGNLVACHVACNTAKELRRRAGRRYPLPRQW